MKSSDEGYKMLGKNIPFFHEVNALPIPLDIRRLNDGEGIESTMKRKNAKYHNLSRKFNNTNLERAQKRHMSPMEGRVNVHSTRLKDKLLQKMPELEAHTKGRDVLLMFEKDIGPAIAFAYDYIDTMHMEKTAEMIRCQRDQIILPTSKPNSKKAPELPDAYMNMKPAYLKTKPEPLILPEDVTGILNHNYLLMSLQNESGCLPLAIETGRYTKPKTLLNDRKCKYCTVDCVEDEKHVVMHCEFYSDLRYGLFLKACAINPNFNDFDDDDKFIFLMSDDSIQPFLAKSLYFMFNHRKYCV
ncbi:unnamed protein product [Mytilus coruscus]|uniref:Uncharacterized protein n=1 Tax=Mytilus coruscus TaxID=42192 RepID=A0A6J8APF3_MYTCO|nr:unnamed protein product [Mytilus coruscus]